MYYPSSEKGDDQLHDYRQADLRVCFRICRLLVFPWGGSYEFLGKNKMVQTRKLIYRHAHSIKPSFKIIKTFFMLRSPETKIYPAHNVKKPTIDKLLAF